MTTPPSSSGPPRSSSTGEDSLASGSRCASGGIHGQPEPPHFMVSHRAGTVQIGATEASVHSSGTRSRASVILSGWFGGRQQAMLESFDRTWAMSPPPRQPNVYHITHVDNLPAIVDEGSLVCDREMIRRGGPAQAVGMSEIKRRRVEQLAVDCHPGTMVGDYVPFYFCPRSVMLYVIHMANHRELAYRGGQGPNRPPGSRPPSRN